MKIVKVKSKKSQLDPTSNPFLNRGSAPFNETVGFMESYNERGIRISMSSTDVYPVTLRSFIPDFRIVEVIDLLTGEPVNPILG